MNVRARKPASRYQRGAAAALGGPRSFTPLEGCLVALVCAQQMGRDRRDIPDYTFTVSRHIKDCLARLCHTRYFVLAYRQNNS